MQIENLFEDPDIDFTEISKSIFRQSHDHVFKFLQIDRIYSNGVASDKNFYYNQDFDEWILIIEGEATLEINKIWHKLVKGSYLYLPKHVNHRVESTSQDCIWLTISWK